MDEQQSYLSDIEFNPVRAGTGKRFLNYLCDLFFFLIIFYALAVAFVASGGRITESPAYSGSDLLFRLFAMILFVVYYFLFELLCKGRTIGKFITGTKAVNEDGSEMGARTVLLRSLSRIVPFEALSAFGGHPWHDTWNHTYVIDVKRSSLNI